MRWLHAVRHTRFCGVSCASTLQCIFCCHCDSFVRCKVIQGSEDPAIRPHRIKLEGGPIGCVTDWRWKVGQVDMPLGGYPVTSFTCWDTLQHRSTHFVLSIAFWECTKYSQLLFNAKTLWRERVFPFGRVARSACSGELAKYALRRVRGERGRTDNTHSLSVIQTAETTSRAAHEAQCCCCMCSLVLFMSF